MSIAGSAATVEAAGRVVMSALAAASEANNKLKKNTIILF